MRQQGLLRRQGEHGLRDFRPRGKYHGGSPQGESHKQGHRYRDMSLLLNKKYLEVVDYELDKLNSSEFTGNIEFQVNFKKGGIGSMNVVLRKSVKFEDVIS